MVESKDSLRQEYESRLNKIRLVRNEDGRQTVILIPVCYCKATTHVRKPVKSEADIERMMLNTLECAECPLREVCHSLESIDLLDQNLMFQRENNMLLKDLRGMLKNGVK